MSEAEGAEAATAGADAARPAGWRSPRRLLLLSVGALLVFVAVVSARMLVGARAELRRAATAASAARVRHLRRAMAYYLPGSPYVRQAREQLLQVAARHQQRGEHASALRALRSLRQAIVRLRSFYQPFADDLPRLSQRIAALSTPRAAAGAAGAAGAKGRAAQRRLSVRLASPPQLDPLFTALGLLGFVAYTAGGFWLIARGLTRDATIVRSRLLVPVCIVAFGLGAFALGMVAA